MQPPSTSVPTRRRSRGFTLTEVMLATFVLALAITTAVTTMQRGFAMLDTARNTEMASLILQTEMERERLLPWATVTSGAYTPAIDTAILGIPAAAGRFTLSRSVSYVPNRSNQILQITLTVTWRDYNGRSVQRTLSTYYGNGGLYNYLTTQT